MTSDQVPTFMDHYQLNFWLWACRADGETYLAACKAGEHKAAHDVRNAPQMELAKYHFVTATGSLLRNLERSQNLFPSIKPACEKAQHLFAEGKLLRDMIEHADDYFQGKGQKQASFVREARGILPGLPGAGVIADATSTVVTDEGHWLGGRLCVERVLAEVRAIAEEAAKIPPPKPTRHR